MSDEKLVTWVNGCLDKTVPDWTDSWSSGQLYIDLVANFRPDLTQGQSFAGSGKEACEQIFAIINEKLNLAILVDPSDIRELDNVAFIGQLKDYFESPEFEIDKELSSGDLTHPLPRVSSSHSNNNLADIRRPLCSRLFERKSVEERMTELKDFDGIEITKEPQLDDSNPFGDEITEEKSTENLAENTVEKTAEQPEEKAIGKKEESSELKSTENETDNPFSSDLEDETNENDDKPAVEKKHIEPENPFGDDSEDDEISEKLEIKESTESLEKKDTGNPFGSEDDEEDPSGGNPFEDEPGEENEKERNSTNPFGSDDNDDNPSENPGNPFGDFEENETPSKTPPKRPPPPKLQPTKPTRKKGKAPSIPKGQAPQPPTQSGENRPKRPPPPRPKETQAPGYGHPLVKRQVSNKEEEIKIEMVELEQKLQDLEVNAAKLEDMLRFSSESGQKDDDLMGEWLAIVRERNELARKDIELGHKLRLNRLEVKHAELEFEMRKILHKPVDAQTEGDKKREAEIMDELVVLVNKRDEIIESIELERERANSRETTPKPTATPEPVKVKKKRGVSMKKFKSFVKSKKDK